MKKNDIINATIKQRASITKTIAYYDDMKILIDGGYEGQNADIRITKKKNSRCEGTIVRTMIHSEHQTPAECDDFSRCGGCFFGDISYEYQLKLKQDYVYSLFDKANLKCTQREPILASPVHHEYRNKMEFSFGDEYINGPLTLGMHERNKHHSIVPLKNCLISPEDFNTVRIAVEKYFNKHKLPFYNKHTKEGYMRHLVLRHSVFENAVLINLVTTTQCELNKNEFSNMLASLPLKGKIAGILHTENDSFADAVKPESVEILFGTDMITEKVCGLEFNIGPFSFFQTNTRGAEVLYEKVREYASDTTNKTIFDLYCGTGTIAQILAEKAEKVYGIEIVEEAVEAAKTNAEKNGLHNCTFLCGDVLKTIDELNDKADLIILDPPRAGLHPKAIDKIIAYMPATFIYVSCNAVALIKDLPSFLNAGYTVQKMCPVDMFPYTPHVETCVLLSHKNS